MTIRRRDFIPLLGSVAAWPLAARAQRSVPVIGFLSALSAKPSAYLRDAFLQGLSEVSFAEGRDFTMEYRWAEHQYDRLPELATDLVRRGVSLIAATGGVPSALAAKAATATIPIVFTIGDDPVKHGLVASFNRPGGNITGITLLAAALDAKRLQILHELVPTATSVAFLMNPENPQSEAQATEINLAARTIGLQLRIIKATTDREIEDAFAAISELKADALILGADGVFTSRRNQLVGLAARAAIPVIYQRREFVDVGGLISYGESLPGAYREAGIYAGQMLKGKNPADLPVQQPTKFELVINMKTAKTIGLTVPPIILLRANEVVE